MKLRICYLMLCAGLTIFSCSSEQRAQKQIHKGLEFEKLERYDEAIYAFQEAIKIKPELAEAHCELGGVYFKQGSFAMAVSCYQQAVRLKPDYAEAYFDMGSAYTNLELWSKSLESFKEAERLNKDPNLFGAIPFYIGQAHFRLRDYDRAVVAFQKSIDLHYPFPSIAYSMLGNSYGALNRLNEASIALQEAIRLDPNNEMAKNGLAICRLQTLPMANSPKLDIIRFR